MNDINRRFTVWLSGYYEDFQTMRVISEGEDYAESSFFTNRRDSHAGNTMAAQAYNNSRFAFDYLTRSFASKAPLPLVGQQTESESASLHNEGPSQWLTFDTNRIGSAFYEGRATLTYPDTLGDAASLRTFSFPKRADYSHFASGWGTQNSYYVRQGDTDATYERSSFIVDTTNGNPYGAAATRGYGKFDITGTQPADASGIPQGRGSTGYDNTNYRRHKIMMNSSLCGVYLGETGDRPFESGGMSLPYAYLYPIKSPSGKPFFRHTISRRYADYLDANVSATGGGKNKYDFANGANFSINGYGGLDDKWFPLNQTTQTIVATGQTYNAGATSIVLPASLPTPPPTTNLLDPSIPNHLPRTNLPSAPGVPCNTIQLDGATFYYSSFSINGSGDVTYNLADPAGLPITFIQPSVTIYQWQDQQAGDNTITYYNLTAGGTPNEFPTWQYRQDVGDGGGLPLLCHRDILGNVRTTTARTRNGRSGSQNSPVFTISSSSIFGYTIYSMTVELAGGHGGFQADPLFYAANDPFFSLDNVYGELNLGDYVLKQGSNAPEKVVTINGDGSIETDGNFGGVLGSVRLRKATHGSGNGGITGRITDGLHGFQPVIVGDTELNAQSDGERFTIRLANQSFDRGLTVPGQVDCSYMLSVGYNKNEDGFELNERGNMLGSKAAITHLFRPVLGVGIDVVRKTQFNMFENGVAGETTYTMDQLWYDIDIVVDFTAQAYYVFANGTMVGPGTFNAKTDGTPWTPADFYGWSLGIQFCQNFDVDFDAWQTMTTMIDRAGYIYAVSDRMTHGILPANIQQDDVIFSKFKIKSMVDGISQGEFILDDDSDLINLPQLVSGRPNWKMLLFRDNDYRPIHSSIVSAVNFKQSNKKKTKDIILKTQDSIGELDFQFPYFDIGQENGAPSLVAAYRRYEITNYADIFHFGTTSLLNLNPVLGFDENSKGSTGEYLPRYDQRMRLYSGHPIQLYSNENTNGPNYTEDAWEVSRLIDHFRPDLIDATKTRVMLKPEFLPWSDDMIPAGIQVAIKGNWRNRGTSNSDPATPEVGELGLLTQPSSTIGDPSNTPHNEMRGLHTVLQAQSVITANLLSGTNYIILDDTSLFPNSGTVKVGGTGASHFGATSYTYTSKNSGGLFITGTLGQEFAAGTVVRETTSTDYFIIDKQWQRSLVVESISDDGGFLRFNFVPSPDFPHRKFEFMGGTSNANGDSVFAKNDRMTPTIAPNPQLIRIYVQPNAAGIAHNADMADLPSQVYTSGTIIQNSNGQGNIKTTTPVSSLSANLQAALPITLGVGAGGIADGLEADLAYMSFPKKRGKSFSLRNVGSSYSYRNIHTRWLRDIPQSLWFQKTFGVIGEYPYGSTSWRGATRQTAALADLQNNFNSGVDTSITINKWQNFPTNGVCEIWTNNPNPNLSSADQAIMLTSFTYEGKTFTSGDVGTLDNIKFADPNKGIITTSGGAGNRVVIARNTDGDYKHCFVLFADMRNDGTADADGGTRKEDFGLLHPIQQNYKLKVVWADSGKDFVDLKIGADADIWQLSAENDPNTGNPWSNQPSAIMIDYDNPARLIGKRSNTTELSPDYHDWQDKAGAFVIVDMSKFFNLNTEANLGRIGQSAGGNKQLGEYLVEGAGEPTLIDNYHYQAAATFQNAVAPIIQHFNSYRWADAKTTLTQDIVSSSPVGQNVATINPGDTEIQLADNTSFPATGTNLLVNGDTFDYTGKGGVMLSAQPGILGQDFTANGTFTTTGGGASVNAQGTYKVEFELTTTTAGTFQAGSGWGASQTYNWAAITGKASGIIQSDGGGSLDPSTISIVRNDYYESSPTIRITASGGGGSGGFDPTGGLQLEAQGQLKFGEPFTITNAGIGFTSNPGFLFSTGTTGSGFGTFSSTLLLGVSGIAGTHLAGSTITFSSSIDYLDVEDTSFFPSKAGINAFAGQNTAGIIEAKTTDAQGNEFDMQYVFTYTSKTLTRLQGIKYRAVKQGESVDTAAIGLWSDDTFTVSGVPSINAEGSVIRASLGSSFPMGFMLKLEGRIKSPGIGNYYEHDKIRIYQQSALFDDWFKQMTLPALSDFNNVPIMRDYNISGNTAGAGSVESFGSVTQAQNKSIFQTLRTMAQAAGIGSNGSLITLNFQMGRDNRMEFRPTYNSGISLDRNNLKVSDLKTSKAKSFSHVRVLYNGGDSFVTFPALNYKENVRFKFVSAIPIASYEQALAVAKQEYQKKKDPAFKVEAEVIRESNETQRTGPMLFNARYGYIADPAVQLTGRNGGYWTAGRGGLHFTGQNNALHGNIHGYGLLSLLNYQAVATMGIGIGGYAGAGDYTTTYGNSLAHYPTNDLYNTFPWTQMYYWYGAKSVSYAAQIVHIPKGMPKVSETTGEELRIFISDAVATIPNSDRPDNLTAGKKFNIHFADYGFNKTQSGTKTPTLQATQQGIETITTLGSGFFEVPIPASYWFEGNTAGAKMVVSVNAEYLAAVARHKTADKFGGNALLNQTGLILAGGQTAPTFSNANEFSIFPLGIREYPELGTSAVERSPWYAPRIHITDDINFIPGTYAQYNDSYLDINETMFISRVEYEYTPKNLDRVKLVLEREIGRIPDGLEGYLATNPLEDTGASGGGVGGGGGGQNTPPAGGNTGGRGDTPTTPYKPTTPEAFPKGYTGGQKGTADTNNSPPLKGGVDADLGGVSTPIKVGVEYLRLNNDTGVQQMGQQGSSIAPSFSVNNLDTTTANKFNGSMSLDNLLPNGVQGIPGQPRPAKLAQKTKGLAGIDAKFVSAEGEAAETDEGWILPGASTIGLSEASTNVQHSLNLYGTVPMDSAQPVIGLSAYVSAEILDGEQLFTLETTITCEDTGESITHSHTQLVTQPGGSSIVNHKQITLLPQQFFASAGIEGRRLKATITRKPGQGVDNMLFSSVVVHGIQFENVVHNNQGKPTTESLDAFAGKEKETTSDGLNLNSGTNPL